MSYRLLRTSTAIDECEQHLTDTATFGSPIESYLTRHIAVLLCADVQEAIYEIVEARGKQMSDPAIHQFINNSTQKILRSIMKGEIAGFIGHFGQDKKDAFNALCNDADVSRYNNVVALRHDVAHQTGTSVSFQDLKLGLEAAKRILESFEKALF